MQSYIIQKIKHGDVKNIWPLCKLLESTFRLQTIYILYFLPVFLRYTCFYKRNSPRLQLSEIFCLFFFQLLGSPKPLLFSTIIAKTVWVFYEFHWSLLHWTNVTLIFCLFEINLFVCFGWHMNCYNTKSLGFLKIL